MRAQIDFLFYLDSFGEYIVGGDINRFQNKQETR